MIDECMSADAWSAKALFLVAASSFKECMFFELCFISSHSYIVIRLLEGVEERREREKGSENRGKEEDKRATRRSPLKFLSEILYNSVTEVSRHCAFSSFFSLASFSRNLLIY